MGFYEYLWVSGCLWISMGVYGFLGVYRYLWVSMGLYRCLWVSMSTYRFFWIFGCLRVFIGVMGVYGRPWGFIDFWVSMGTHGWHERL